MNKSACKHFWNFRVNSDGKLEKCCFKCDLTHVTTRIFENWDSNPPTNVLNYSKGDAYKFDKESWSNGPIKLDFETPFDTPVNNPVNNPVNTSVDIPVNTPMYRTCYHYIAWICSKHNKPSVETSVETFVKKDYTINRVFKLEGKKPVFLSGCEDLKITNDYIKIVEY